MRMDGWVLQAQCSARRVRRTCTLAVLLILGLVSSGSARPPVARPETPRESDQLARIEELLRQQEARWEEVGGRFGDIQERLDQIQRHVGEQGSDGRSLREALHGTQENLRDMREEVRGLYVESSGLKGDIAQVSDRLESLAEDLGSFRLSAGILAALVVLLQVVIIGLLVRSRS